MSGKVTVVTGSAQGLGRATATLLAEVGAKVVVADLNLAGAREVASEIEAQAGIAMAHALDVADEASVHAMFKAIDAQFGSVDVLVNNVPYRVKAEFFDMSFASGTRCTRSPRAARSCVAVKRSNACAPVVAAGPS